MNYSQHICVAAQGGQNVPLAASQEHYSDPPRWQHRRQKTCPKNLMHQEDLADLGNILPSKANQLELASNSAIANTPTMTILNKTIPIATSESTTLTLALSPLLSNAHPTIKTIETGGKFSALPVSSNPIKTLESVALTPTPIWTTTLTCQCCQSERSLCPLPATLEHHGDPPN